MENKYYVYAYLNQNKSCKLELNGLSFLYEPFYIGKGKDNRCNIHLISSRLKLNKHLSNTIKKIGVDKVRPFITKIYTNLSEKDAIDLEILLISEIGKRIDKMGPLVNITNGGEGVSGLKHTEESRAKMSLIGEKHPKWGVPITLEHREILSKNMKLNNPMKNPETAEKVRLSNIGRTPWNKGSKTPSEVCEKLSDVKIKYRDIKIVSKSDIGDIKILKDTNDAKLYLKKCHKSILNYINKRESIDYYWYLPNDIDYNKY